MNNHHDNLDSHDDLAARLRSLDQPINVDADLVRAGLQTRIQRARAGKFYRSVAVAGAGAIAVFSLFLFLQKPEPTGVQQSAEQQHSGVPNRLDDTQSPVASNIESPIVQTKQATSSRPSPLASNFSGEFFATFEREQAQEKLVAARIELERLRSVQAQLEHQLVRERLSRDGFPGFPKSIPNNF